MRSRANSSWTPNSALLQMKGTKGNNKDKKKKNKKNTYNHQEQKKDEA